VISTLRAWRPLPRPTRTTLLTPHLIIPFTSPLVPF
jgi:hypothetical protein